MVAQRVVDLLAEGGPAESIVAFTFTERAAEELKLRIARRVEHRLGREALDRLTNPAGRFSCARMYQTYSATCPWRWSSGSGLAGRPKAGLMNGASLRLRSAGSCTPCVTTCRHPPPLGAAPA
ncbi:MAG: UvrD-helicase domain-containing protein [Candidatus Rokuibacteriota bacterium]